MPSSRRNASSGSPFEPKIGFSRAVRIGNIIAVSGTAPIGTDGKLVGLGDPAAQTRRCLEIIRDTLATLDCPLSSVIRTRVYLTNIEDWQAAGEAHGEFFSEIRPASTLLEVSRLINPDWLVEIEADAVVED